MRAPASEAIPNARLSQPLSDECSQRPSGRLPPTDAERVARWIGVHLVSLVALQVTRLKHAGTERDRLLVRLLGVLDVEV